MFKSLFILALIMVSSQALEGVVELTDANFASELYSNSDEPTLWIVLFAADWVPLFLFIVWSLPTSQTRILKTRRKTPRTRSQVGSCYRQEQRSGQ
jgi:hypothetical protein